MHCIFSITERERERGIVFFICILYACCNTPSLLHSNSARSKTFRLFCRLVRAYIRLCSRRCSSLADNSSIFALLLFVMPNEAHERNTVLTKTLASHSIQEKTETFKFLSRSAPTCADFCHPDFSWKNKQCSLKQNYLCAFG